MALATETLTGFSREAVVELSRLRNEPQWMADWRLAAWDVYESLPMPQRTDEEWRRTDLRSLKLDRYAPFTGVGETVSSLDGVLAKGSIADAGRAGVVVQRDASTIYAEANADAVPAGVIFAVLTTAVDQYGDVVREYLMTKAVPVDFGKFEALHAAFW